MALSKIESQALDVGQIGGRRNLIINGAMQVAQRGTSQSIAASTTLFPVDRMEVGFGAHTELAGTVSQSTIAPSEFSNSTKIDITTAETSLAAGEGVTFRQKFEGQNLQQLAKGTADAKQVTLSFWVRSSQTGTYVAELYDNDNARQISKSYTIDTANTWEYKTITFPADTTGSFDNDNNLSLFALWWLCAGSTYSSGTLNDDAWATVTNADRAVGQTNLIGSVNDWYITGVQLEVGSVATPFEHRSYGEELALCQRYYYNHTERGARSPCLNVGFYSSSSIYGVIHFPVPMRTIPSLDFDNQNDLNYRVFRGSGSSDNRGNEWGIQRGAKNSMAIYATGVSGSEGQAGWVETKEASGSYGNMAFDAEL
jgi:hypothetical protein